MTKKSRSWEFFPKEEVVRLQDAIIYWLLFGTFGAHQFYLGNKKRAYYLLATCGTSHLMVLLIPKLLPYLKMRLGFKFTLIVLLVGYALGVPVLIWDLITLPGQVRDKNGQADLL